MTRAAAERVLAEQSDDSIGRAELTAFSHPATTDERALLNGFLDEQTSRYLDPQPEERKPSRETINECRRKALADLCHMLMSANEFVYVD